jgi:hypothetical protein
MGVPDDEGSKAVTESVFREGGPLKVLKTGDDEYSMSIEILPDARGHIGRKCPSDGCSPGYFKVKNGTGITEGQTRAFCPYCRHSGEPSDFFTELQVQYAKDLVMREVAQGVNRIFEQALGLGPSRRKKLGGGLVSVELSYKPGTLPHVSRPVEEELRRDVVCPNCTLEHAVFGLAVWCADCGADIFMTHVTTECASLSAGLADVERRRQLLGARVAARDVENALEDIVSVFEATLGFVMRRSLEGKGKSPEEVNELFDKTVRNALQNVERASALYRDHFDIDILGSLSDEEKDFLRVSSRSAIPSPTTWAWSIAGICARSGRESCRDATCGSRQMT